MGLKFSDFDLDDKFVRINRQLVKDAFLSDNPDALRVKVDKYELIEKPPKKDSYRTLRVPKVIITEVKRRKRKQEECQEYYKDFVDYDYISFQEKTGLPHIPTSFNSFLYKICPKIGISNVSVHGLRHTFATILIEHGVPIIKIAALLGHSNPHTTFEVYCDVMEEKEKILAFINNTFSLETIEEEKWQKN